MELSRREVEDRKHLVKADLADANLAGVDLSHKNLTAANLRGASLHSATLVGTNFAAADLTGANLNDSVLHSATFTATILDEATFNDADLTGSGFSTHVHMPGWSEVGFVGASLIGASFVRAKLWQTSFGWSDLTGADFALADIRSATFLNSDLTGANFAGTKFPDPSDRVARMSGLQSVDFEGSVLASVDLSRLKDVWLDLRGTDVSGSDLASVDVSEVTFITNQEWYDNCDELEDQQPSVSLQRVDFSGATISWSNLRGIVYDNGESFDGGDGEYGPSGYELTIWPEGFDPVTAGVTFK